jgi:HlyD family secretion protein
MKATKPTPGRKKLWIGITAAVLILAAASYLVVAGGQSGKKQASLATAAYQTVKVSRGDLSVSISGTGQVQAAETVDLGFPVSGTVTELDVALGDEVSTDQVLARLGGLDALQLEVDNRQLALMNAQKELDDLLGGSDLNLAQAQVDRVAAEEAYKEAQKNLHHKGDPRCEQSLTETYYFQYLEAQLGVHQWEIELENPKTDYGRDYILNNLYPFQQSSALAYANWKYCEAYTDMEIAESQANLMLAEANLKHTRDVYDALLAVAGLDPLDYQIKLAARDNAQLQLEQAQKNLAGATLTAPIDGTVIVLNNGSDEVQANATYITLADTQKPVVDVSIDETDLENFQVGCAAEVTLDLLPDQSFSGVVTEVDPQISMTNFVSAAKGLVVLNNEISIPGIKLPMGLTGVVEITCSQANRVLMVDRAALHEATDGSTYVYVLDKDGQPEKRQVVTGLKTDAYAEIVSGLDLGEEVITSTVNLP